MKPEKFHGFAQDLKKSFSFHWFDQEAEGQYLKNFVYIFFVICHKNDQGFLISLADPGAGLNPVYSRQGNIHKI